MLTTYSVNTVIYSLSSMPRSSRKGKQETRRSAAVCNHIGILKLSECLGLLHTLSAALSTDAFCFQWRRLAEFIDLCSNQPCSHFKRSFVDELGPGVCQASAKALQLLHDSAGSFQQQLIEC